MSNDELRLQPPQPPAAAHAARCPPPPATPRVAAGMEGIHLDIKHDLGSGGDPNFGESSVCGVPQVRLAV